MAIKKYYDSDCNLGVLDGKTVAVIGFGSQGHAHSENLAESGVNVVVGLRSSAHWEKASEFRGYHENFKVGRWKKLQGRRHCHDAGADELCADIYNKQVAPYMTEGKATAFAHGFNIHFKTITAPKNVDVIAVVRRAPATSSAARTPRVRAAPLTITVEQDYTGKAGDIAWHTLPASALAVQASCRQPSRRDRDRPVSANRQPVAAFRADPRRSIRWWKLAAGPRWHNGDLPRDEADRCLINEGGFSRCVTHLQHR